MGHHHLGVPRAPQTQPDPTWAHQHHLPSHNSTVHPRTWSPSPGLFWCPFTPYLRPASSQVRSILLQAICLSPLCPWIICLTLKSQTHMEYLLYAWPCSEHFTNANSQPSLHRRGTWGMQKWSISYRAHTWAQPSSVSLGSECPSPELSWSLHDVSAPPASPSFSPSHVLLTFFLKKYLFLAALGLHCCVWAISSCSECGFLSCCRAPVLGRVGFSSDGTLA